MATKRQIKGRRAPPLCVDLDGTLVRSDLLIESFFEALKRNVVVILAAPLWLLRGKAYLKHRLAAIAVIDCRLLPYNEELVQYLRTQRAGGRRLILTTASNERYAGAVAQHLSLFDDVIASDERRNLSGSKKRDALVERFGAKGFDYAGNGRADLKVFRDARHGILVEPELGVEGKARRLVNLEMVMTKERNSVKTLARALRLHQWLKNLLVFVPLVAAHKYMDVGLLSTVTGAFVAFGLCASATYLVNDAFDLASDRAHPRKCRRPLASGNLSLKLAMLLIAILLVSAFALGLALSRQFALVLLGYVVVTLSYSLWLKRKVIVDVLVLAGLYTLRIIAGAAVTGIALSFWLLAFSMFLFLSLAMVKRYAEMLTMKAANKSGAAGRGYQLEDTSTLQSLGAASGYMSVLVLALYINSQEVRYQYQHPEVIWVLCPLLLYWISRMWQRAGRDQMHDDPLVYAVQDRISRWVALIGLGVLVVAALA